jgi:hypothetical protein
MVRPVGLETRLAFPEKGAAGVIIKRGSNTRIATGNKQHSGSERAHPGDDARPQHTGLAHLIARDPPRRAEPSNRLSLRLTKRQTASNATLGRRQQVITSLA